MSLFLLHLFHMYFIVKFIWFECEVYDENYVHMKRHRDMGI